METGIIKYLMNLLFNIKHSTFKIILVLVSLVGIQLAGFAQLRVITLQQAVDEALQNNGGIKSANYAIELQKALKKSAVNIDKTSITLSQGQLNSVYYDNNLNISQRFEHPSVYKNQLRLANERIKGTEYELDVNKLDLVNNVKLAYYHFIYLINTRSLLRAQDSLYANLVKASAARYRTGETTLLEKATSETSSLEIKNRMQQNEIDVVIAQQQLQILLSTNDSLMVADTSILKRDLQLSNDSAALANNPTLKYLQQQITINEKETAVQRSKGLPDFHVGYTNQSFRGIQNVDGIDQKFTGSDRFNSFQVGVAIPLLPGGHKAKVNAAKINEKMAEARLGYEQVVLRGRLKMLLQQYYKHKAALNYYENTALPQADLIIKNAEKGFRAGELSYVQYQQSLATALKIKTDYIENIYQYNQSTLVIESIVGTK